MERAEFSALVGELFDLIRQDGGEVLLAQATGVLNLEQRLTAFAVGCKTVASDGEINHGEVNFLLRLAGSIGLNDSQATGILEVMAILCRDVLA